MKRFRISTLLLVTALASLLMGLLVQFPGPVIVMLSFIPMGLVFRYARPEPGAGSELTLIAVLALSALPPYLTCGPVLHGGNT